VSDGTELPAIWPSEIVGLYTILWLEGASVQDFAGFARRPGGAHCRPRTPASLSLLPGLNGNGDPPNLVSCRARGYETPS
jgi:hypothetical protein